MHTGIRRHALGMVIAAQTALVGPLAAAAPASPPRQISLESDCSGCPKGTRIVLHADGLIQWQQLGKARRGTADRTRQGRVSPEDFAAVAHLWQAGGLARMPAELPDDGTRDGPWASLRLERADGSAEQILRRGDTGSPALVEVAEALRRTARKLWPDAP